MDANRFDRLARSLGTATRRGALGALLAGLAPLFAPDAAGKRGRGKRQHRHNGERQRKHERDGHRHQEPERVGVEKKGKHKKKCKVKCGGKTCGPSNCKGKTCGTCIPPTQCNAQGQCVGCLQPTDCASGTCCNEICCSAGEICSGEGKCVDCLTNDDCAGGEICSPNQRCCTPNCDGRRCGPDGCGGTCACPSNATCNANGKCICDLPGKVVCNGACITAECCADGLLPGVQCDDQCQQQPAPGLNCCQVGSGCTDDEQCCSHASQGTVCFGGTCCQPIGANCTINTPCCAGFCHLGTCTTCTAGGCCTDNEAGCPQGKTCCGQTCITENACCTDNTPGCPPGKKCCGGTCINIDVCCTNGTANACPTDRPHCLEGDCVQCGQPPVPPCEFKPCTAGFGQCIDGTCVYSPGHEGDQCLLPNGKNGICCNGVCSGCCNNNPTTCPIPGPCQFKSCEGNVCNPVDAPDSHNPNGACGSKGRCCSGFCCDNACCSDGCCPEGKDRMKCRSSGFHTCCYKGGVKLGVDVDPNLCCAGDAGPDGKCFEELF